MFNENVTCQKLTSKGTCIQERQHTVNIKFTKTMNNLVVNCMSVRSDPYILE